MLAVNRNAVGRQDLRLAAIAINTERRVAIDGIVGRYGVNDPLHTLHHAGEIEIDLY